LNNISESASDGICKDVIRDKTEKYIYNVTIFTAIGLFFYLSPLSLYAKFEFYDNIRSFLENNVKIKTMLYA